MTIRHTRALVTGAASGIGRAVALALQQQGVQVIGLDIKVSPALEYPLIRMDLCDEQQIISAVAEAAEQLQGLNLLVNAAGIEIAEPLAALQVESLDRMYQVNVRGLMLVTREALKVMPRSGDDAFRVINIASELGYLGRGGASGYCATKAAVIALTRSWAREWGPLARVNAVAPGPVDTELLGYARLSAEERALECQNPLERIGQPEEVAAVVSFLSSEGAGFITGQCYNVDGGAAMH